LGLNWAVGEIAETDLKEDVPFIEITFNVVEDTFNGKIK